MSSFNGVIYNQVFKSSLSKSDIHHNGLWKCYIRSNHCSSEYKLQTQTEESGLHQPTVKEIIYKWSTTVTLPMSSHPAKIAMGVANNVIGSQKEL